MRVKVFEVRDRGTFLPVIATEVDVLLEGEAASYLLRRVGYGEGHRYVLLTRASADGAPCNYDPHAWGDRTMATAHRHIERHFDELEDGAVVDVEIILGELSRAKRPEREGEPL